MRAHRFNTATFDRPTEAFTGIDLSGRNRMKGFMILQPRSVRRHLSISPTADASLLAEASADRLVSGLSFHSQDRLLWLFGDLLDEDLLPRAAKRPAKADDEEEDEEDEEEEEGDQEEEEETADEEEGDEEDEEEEEDDEEEDDEDEFDDPDTGFDDDDDDDEDEDFDDDE